MAKKMSEDEIMDHTYNRLFGDLDRIESGELFKEDGEGLGAPQKVTPNAGTAGIEGIELSIKPIMKGAAESGRPPEGGIPAPEDAEEEEIDKLKGISRMSPLMSQLHGGR
jgi:hypothetical protein